MSRVSDRDLTPRNGHTLMAGLGARISGCGKQKEVSLEDQTDHNKEIVEDWYQGIIEYLIVATKGKGERLDRPELAQIEAEFRKGYLDIFVIEDLGRLVRGVEAVRLLGIAVDHGVRVIVPNDNIDTAKESWETDAIKACADHVAHQEHTSRRLKHKLKNRFVKYGGSTARPIAAYVVPEGAKTYGDWLKAPGAEAWIHDGKKMLCETRNCSAVADMFNRRGIAPGPYCRRNSWNGAMVRRFYANPLLKGMAARCTKHSKKFHEVGRRKSVKNPNGPVYYACPHLAFMTTEEFDELAAVLQAINARYKRKPVNGRDPLAGVPRKRTRFPGQYARCWYCGRHYVWGGNGITDNLQCSGSREWLCWNSVGFDGPLAVSDLVARITNELYALDGFEAQYQELVAAALRGDRSDIALRHAQLRRDEQALHVKKANVQQAILAYGTSPLIQQMLDQIAADERQLNIARRTLDQAGQKQLQVPESLDELRMLWNQEFAGSVLESPEFGDLLRQVVPDFRVHLVRLCDGGSLLPRAHVQLRLDGIVTDLVQVPGVKELLYRELTLDVFQAPPREQVRLAATALAAEGLGPKAIAARVSEQLGRPTTSKVVHDALALDQQMKQLGLSTPYVLVSEPPDDMPKQRKHRNTAYKFTPLDGYVPPAL